MALAPELSLRQGPGRAPRSPGLGAALSAGPDLPALLGFSHVTSATVVGAPALSYRAGMSMHLWPDPAVNSNAPVRIFCFAYAVGGAPAT